MDQKLDATAVEARRPDIKEAMRELGVAARAAARLIARADTATKNAALAAIAARIRADSRKLVEANKADVAGAKKAGRDAAFVDRLTLDAQSVEHMAEAGD